MAHLGEAPASLGERTKHALNDGARHGTPQTHEISNGIRHEKRSASIRFRTFRGGSANNERNRGTV